MYGIVDVVSEIAQFTGTWQRVELLKANNANRDEFVTVRFLDAGGTETMSICDIFCIHQR